MHTAQSLVLVARGFKKEVKYDESIKTTQEALDFFLSTYDGRQHANVAMALYCISNVLSKKGRV